MTKSEIIDRIRHGLFKIHDKKVHAMVDLEINRIKNMTPAEFEAYKDKYTPAEVPSQIQVRKHR